jgi:hypothetical protein
LFTRLKESKMLKKTQQEKKYFYKILCDFIDLDDMVHTPLDVLLNKFNKIKNLYPDKKLSVLSQICDNYTCLIFHEMIEQDNEEYQQYLKLKEKFGDKN